MCFAFLTQFILTKAIVDEVITGIVFLIGLKVEQQQFYCLDEFRGKSAKCIFLISVCLVY